MKILRALAIVVALAGPALAESPVIYGVTIETTHRLEALTRALAAHQHRPTVRLVFQEGTTPADYAKAVPRIAKIANIMGMVADSTAMAELDAAALAERQRQFQVAFGAQISLWEVGNELNGEWVGPPDDTRAKLSAAIAAARTVGGPDVQLALTLNHWPGPDCFTHDWEATVPYARAIPAADRALIDLLLLSYYEQSCSDRLPEDARALGDALAELAPLFPNARLGMGEVGVRKRTDPLAFRRAVIARDYGHHQALSARFGARFVGGYFWWSYSDDAVGRSGPGPLWPDLERAFDSMAGQGAQHAAPSGD